MKKDIRNADLHNPNLITNNTSTQLKGVAIMLVLISHLVLAEFINVEQLRFTGSYGVAIFLILSGYGLTESYKKDSSLSNYFYKRFSKVIFPYSLVTFAWIIIDLIVFRKRYSLQVIATSVAGLDLTRSIDPSMWYISFLILWYVIFYLIFKLPLPNIVKALVLFGIAYFLNNQYMSDYQSISYQGRLHAYNFPIGVLLSLYGSRLLKTINNSKIIFLAILVALSTASFYMLYPSTLVSMAYYSGSNLAFALSSIFLFMIIDLFDIKLMALSMMGNISYEMYLFEFVLLFKYGLITLSDSKVIGGLTYFLVLILISVLFHKLVHLIINWNRKRVDSTERTH